MYIKCLFLLFFINYIDAEYLYRPSRSRFGSTSVRCPMPDNQNVITRTVQRGKFVKFSCRRGYAMIGNKYATCRGGDWDVPLPICIKSGCQELEEVKNSVKQTYNSGAWVVYFCLPRHTLVGSPVVYCDGNMWNATAPKCIDSSAQSKTSCDFEQDLCGWKQDEIHDFDWRRINTKTPSSFMNTGPSYDHTLGMNGNGYYMYIESTSRLENDTARLISPVYDESITSNSCFVFYYHMYGRHIGGLRVYQKPDGITMQDLLRLNKSGKNQYMLFEKWGNQGDFWFTSVSTLLNVSDDFQIVIEGIRGNGFISDIAIDDVALLQGENCTNLSLEPTPTPPTVYSPDSCAGRCREADTKVGYCSCDIYACFANNSCCPDYLEVCVFDNSTDDSSSQTPELPQTQKLIATPKTTFSTTLTIPTFSTTTRRAYTLTTTTAQSTSTSTKKPSTTKSTPTTTRRTTEITTTTAITKPTRTTQRTQAPTRRTTPKWTPRQTTRTKPTTKLTTTTTTPLPTVVTTKRVTRPTVNSTRRPMFTATVKKPGPPLSHNLANSQAKGTNKAITAVTVLLVLAACCGILYGTYYLRTSRGRETLARLRGRATRDSEVRFLKSDTDDVDDE